MITWLQDTFEALSTTFSWAKVVYTAILLGLALIALGEARSLWFDRRLYVGAFSVFENGEQKPADGLSFAQQVLAHQRNLAHLLREEERRRSAATARAASRQETTWWPREVTPIERPNDVLKDLQLSVQGINVREILSKLRQWVSTPNELTGTIEKMANSVRVAAVWNQGPERAAGRKIDGRLLLVDGQPDLDRAAHHVACSLIWAQTADRQASLAEVERMDFCRWLEAWSAFVSIRARQTTVAGNRDPAQVTQLYEAIGRAITDGRPFAEAYRLRADLVDLMPLAERTKLLSQAQSDRTQYAKLTHPQRLQLSGEDLEDLVFAGARPAIRWIDGKLGDDISETWSAVLSPAPAQAHIAAAAAATGIGSFHRKGGTSLAEFGFTGFLVAPDLVLTAGFNIQQAQFYRPGPILPDADYEGVFTFNDSVVGGSGPSLTISEIVLVSSEQPSPFAVLRVVPAPGGRMPQPLTLESKPERLQEAVGRYVAVTGFPAISGHLRRRWMDALLGPGPRVKRVMPGRLLTIDTKDNKPGKLTSDSSTTLGTSGGPLIDLQTGQVIGIHLAGEWKPGQGKFAYAASMPDLLAQPELTASLRSIPGQADATAQTAPAADK